MLCLVIIMMVEMKHNSVLFATNIASDNIQRDNLNPLIIGKGTESLWCIVNQGGVGDS